MSSRSQSSSYPHCSFCLVAEFDIDKGSTLSYQYPAPSGHDEHMLAELMLPDGVHARSEDWTVFFLPEHEREAAAGGVAPNAAARQEGGDEQGKGDSRESLYYVLNLVRTKHDNTVRRGALVKAIAVATRHPFIHIFKPALLLALDDYFRTPGLDVLIRLFDALNSLDLSLMPDFTRSEKLILRASDRRDLFEERFALASRSMTNLRPLMGMAAKGSGASAMDDEEKMQETNDSSAAARIRSRSASDSSSIDEPSKPHASQASSGRRTPHLPHRPSLASLRLGNGSGILRRKPSSATQLQDAMQQAQAGSSFRSISGGGGGAAGMSGHALNKVKDTHVWETSVSYGKIQDLPIRVPTDVFDEEVGEYSLVHLINTFGASHPTGPQHPHLHTNGHLTHPIILLFNAVATNKRIIFLGHNQPANQVAGHVLSLCALASGCGAGWRGIVRRCFPYANLGLIDELERVPGYIAGVTNPRFEELRAWDVLCNIETGRISVAKDIEPALPLRPTAPSTMTDTFSSATYSSGIGPEGEARLVRAPSEPDISIGSNASQTGTVRGRDRAGTGIEARHDAPDNVFMDEITLAISARYGERYVRSRFIDYAANFIRLAARHEEYYYGQTSLAPSNQPFLNGQLGSGAVYADRETELKEVHVNAMRIEGWRATEAYSLLCADEAHRDRQKAIIGIDVGHQLARLRRAKKMNYSEAELIFSTLARTVRLPEQIIELLALLPGQHGGLIPLSNGLFHPSGQVRGAAQEILMRIASLSVGRKLLQNLNLFHRLTFARLLHESQEGTGTSTGFGDPRSGYSTMLGSTPLSMTDSRQNGYPWPGMQRVNGNAADQASGGPAMQSLSQTQQDDSQSRHAASSSLAIPSRDGMSHAHLEGSSTNISSVPHDMRALTSPRSASPAA